MTCNNYDNVSLNGNDAALKTAVKEHIQDAANSHQLKINGAVVTKTLIANRTYGAATGANAGFQGGMTGKKANVWSAAGDAALQARTGDSKAKSGLLNAIQASATKAPSLTIS